MGSGATAMAMEEKQRLLLWCLVVVSMLSCEDFVWDGCGSYGGL